MTDRSASNTVNSTENTPATPTAAPDKTASTPKPSEVLRQYRALWPLVIGLAFGRAGLIEASYGSYTSTDEGIFTDGAMLMALSVLAIFFFILLASKHTLSKRSVNAIMRMCVALEVISILGLGALNAFDLGPASARLCLSALCTLVSSGAIFYWLRRARGTSTTAAALFIFTALIISEVEIYICAQLPTLISSSLAAALALLQYPCMIWARAQKQPYNIVSPTQATDYFGFAKTMIQSKQFLAVTALGIGILSIVIGFLRGYPDGVAIAFTPITRVAYGLLTIGISATIIILVLKRRQRVLTVGIFVVMQVLACLALIASAAFPDMLDIGAIFTTTLNALMVGFTWYIVIAFMSYGWRDPYYYAIAGWLVWLGCRAIARIALIEFYTLSTNEVLVSTLLGAAILVSAQVVFVQFLDISRRGQQEERANHEQRHSVLVKMMGLDEHETLADVRQAAAQQNAEEIGKQFLLSEREIEVLSLYALGHTQKRVAEELFITQGTVHAHIKRIYAKTGLHSRQEILDYMQHYTS